VAKLGGGCCSVVLTSLTDPNFKGTFTQTGGVTTVFFDFINNTGFTIGAVNLDVTDNQTLTFAIDNMGDPYFTSFSPTTATPLLSIPIENSPLYRSKIPHPCTS